LFFILPCLHLPVKPRGIGNSFVRRSNRRGAGYNIPQYLTLRRKWQDTGRERVVLEKDLCAPGRQRSLYRGKKPGPPAVRFLSHFWVSKSARPSVDLSEEVEMMACPLYKLTAFFCLPSFQHGGIRIAISTATSLARGLETVATVAPAAWTIRAMTPDLDS